MIGKKVILIFFAIAVFLSHPVSGTPEIMVNQKIVSGSQLSSNLSLILTEAPNGLSGYNITISLSNASVASFRSVNFPAWAILSSNSSLPADSVWIKAVDLKNSVIKGASNVILANFTVRGDSEGTARVLFTVNDLDDDNGSSYLDANTPPTPTPRGNSDSSSGGGGGGGGAPSDEDFKNIERQESRDVDVHMGLTVYKFTTQDLIREIGFDAKISEGLVTAKIELLKARPKKVTSDAPGSVFKYFNVVVGTSGYGSSSKLENAYIVFNVPDEWLKNNYARSVKLMKFKNNSWIDLKTENISPGTYKAYSPGFSGFAIVGILEGSQEIINTANAQTTKESAVPQKESKSSINLFLIIVVFIVMLLVSFAYLKRKELFKK